MARRNLDDPSPPIIRGWLIKYGELTELAIAEGRLLPEPGGRACRAIAEAVAAFDDSLRQYKASKREQRREQDRSFLERHSGGGKVSRQVEEQEVEPPQEEDVEVEDEEPTPKRSFMSMEQAILGFITLNPSYHNPVNIAAAIDIDEADVLKVARKSRFFVVKKTKDGGRRIYRARS